MYPNMCANLGRGPTVVSKKGGTDKGTLQLYIVDCYVITRALLGWKGCH